MCCIRGLGYDVVMLPGRSRLLTGVHPGVRRGVGCPTTQARRAPAGFFPPGSRRPFNRSFTGREETGPGGR
jgi:hypothetical protein